MHHSYFLLSKLLNMEFLQHINDTLSSFVHFKTLTSIGASGLVLSSGGLLPKVGIGRAMTLALRPLFSSLDSKSVRIKEINALRRSLKLLSKGRYIVVTGGKGYGKSCLINTVVHRNFGVVNISTKSGEDKDEIIKKALREITNIKYLPFDLTSNARRVLFFYGLIFRSTPIIVLTVPERQQRQEYADVTAAVRCLADEFGLRVIVDGSPNSIPPELVATNRQLMMYIDLMDKETIESIPQFNDLHKFLKVNQFDEVVYKVLGGSPAQYIILNDIFYDISIESSDNIILAIKSYIESVLIDCLNNVVAKCTSNTDNMIQKFKELKRSQIPLMELKALGFQLDYPNKVFREVKKFGSIVIEPANPAIHLILCYNVKSDIDIMNLTEDLFTKSMSIDN